MYHVFVTYEMTRYLCSKNEKQNQIFTFDWFSLYNVEVSWCFKTTLAPAPAQLISALQHNNNNQFISAP